MNRHPGPTIRGHEPNGSWTERETRDALAELGARVLGILHNEATLAPWSVKAERVYGKAINAARELGLLEASGPPEERATPADDARASFNREQEERFDRGEVP